MKSAKVCDGKCSQFLSCPLMKETGLMSAVIVCSSNEWQQLTEAREPKSCV